MKVMRTDFRSRHDERGVTMVLIAIAMVSLLAMAALAIDITTLYVAQGEAQNAADAAALAGAKMFVTSGVTSLQTGATPPVTFTEVCQTSGPGSTAAANRQAEAATAQNKVGGQAAVVQQVTCDGGQPGNPRITVTVQRTALPTFFARIWSSATSTVTATATAEAFNASGSDVPIQVQSVKPWLVPNCDPNHQVAAPGGNANCPAGGGNNYDYFINPDSSIANDGSFTGTTLTLRRITTTSTSPVPSFPPAASRFYVIDVPINPPAAVCPDTNDVSCAQVGTNDYLDNIACASRQKFSCGQAYQAQTPPNYGALTRDGVRCLIHAETEGLNQGQDVFTTGGTLPVAINPGANNPNPTLAANPILNISRSDSIVTVPLYDGQDLCPGGACVSGTVVGFLQLGITQTQSAGLPHIEAVILNAVGCRAAGSANPVWGGGAAPIPVRLIHN
jgi:Flp pilus assembly protein TadG